MTIDVETASVRAPRKPQVAATSASAANAAADDAELALAHARDVGERLRAGLASVILGQDDVLRAVVSALLAGGHVLLEGAPGLGKTHIVRTLSCLVGGSFARIQFTPDLMPSDVVGTSLVVSTPEGGKDLAYRPGPIFANLVLADEINRATPKTQSALLEAMAERTVSVEGKPRVLPSPFFVLATENPIEMEGVFPLPEAQLDRFLMKVLVTMPDVETLSRIGAGCRRRPTSSATRRASCSRPAPTPGRATAPARARCRRSWAAAAPAHSWTGAPPSPSTTSAPSHRPSSVIASACASRPRRRASTPKPSPRTR